MSAPAHPIESAYRRKPIAEHNAEMAAHSEQWFAPDPGKFPVVFRYVYATGVWLAAADAPKPRAGFLNYDGKSEVLANAANRAEHLMFRRHDMTAAEFAALPET